MIFALVTSIAYAECTLPRSITELDGLVAEAESSWGGDVASFSEAVATIHPVLGCVNTPLDAPLAARILRLSGLVSFVQRDTVTAAVTFAAARGRDPSIELPASWATEGNPLRAVWSAPSEASPTLTIRKSRRGKVFVDGVETLVVPTDRPFVLQWIDGVRVSAALATDETMPSYPRAAHPARDPMLIASAVAAVGAGALYGLAWAANGDYDNATNRTDMDDAISRANTFTIASGIVGGVAVGALGTGIAFGAVK